MARKLVGSRGIDVTEGEKLARQYGAELVIVKRKDAENMLVNALRLSDLNERHRNAILDVFRSYGPPDRSIPQRARRTG